MLLIALVVLLPAVLGVARFVQADINSQVALQEMRFKQTSSAMEAYFLDWNDYPLYREPGFHFNVLTAPVNYLSEPLPDVFQGDAYGDSVTMVYDYVVERSGASGAGTRVEGPDFQR